MRRNVRKTMNLLILALVLMLPFSVAMATDLAVEAALICDKLKHLNLSDDSMAKCMMNYFVGDIERSTIRTVKAINQCAENAVGYCCSLVEDYRNGMERGLAGLPLEYHPVIKQTVNKTVSTANIKLKGCTVKPLR